MKKSSYQKFRVRRRRLYTLAAMKAVERPSPAQAKALSSVARFTSPPEGAVNVDMPNVGNRCASRGGRKVGRMSRTTEEFGEFSEGSWDQHSAARQMHAHMRGTCLFESTICRSILTVLTPSVGSSFEFFSFRAIAILCLGNSTYVQGFI